MDIIFYFCREHNISKIEGNMQPQKKKHLLEHFGNFKKHNITGQCTGLYRKRIIKCFI